MRHTTGLLAALAAAALAGCASTPGALGERSVTIERTAYGVPHITAPDAQSLAYGVAYAYAQDNLCMTADQLVTARAQRSRHFGPKTTGLLGRRYLPNEQIDLFIAAHMDDAALERAWRQTSAETQALARGYVAGYNRYLADHGAQLPEACRGKPWVQPMTLAHWLMACWARSRPSPQPRPRRPAPSRWTWPTPPRPCASWACSTRPWAPMPGPLARR